MYGWLLPRSVLKLCPHSASIPLATVSSAVAAHNFAFMVTPALQCERMLFFCPSNKSKLADFNTEKNPLLKREFQMGTLHFRISNTVRSIFMDKTVQFRRGPHCQLAGWVSTYQLNVLVLFTEVVIALLWQGTTWTLVCKYTTDVQRYKYLNIQILFPLKSHATVQSSARGGTAQSERAWSSSGIPINDQLYKSHHK